MTETREKPAQPTVQPTASTVDEPPKMPKEIGGTKGPEPTRFGDWEHKGRCTDF